MSDSGYDRAQTQVTEAYIGYDVRVIFSGSRSISKGHNILIPDSSLRSILIWLTSFPQPIVITTKDTKSGSHPNSFLTTKDTKSTKMI